MKENNKWARIFSVGIGSGASTSLCDGLSRASGGHAAYVLGSDRMQARMQSLVEKSMTDKLILEMVSFPQPSVGSKLSDESRSFQEAILYDQKDWVSNWT